MSGKHDLAQDTRVSNKITTDEGKDKVGILQNSSGKILIEVNLSKQNMHDRKITQIIREIFELNNRDLEVEKVVMPIGENTWQIRRTNHSDLKDAGSVVSLAPVTQDRRKTRLKQNRMKVVKRNGLCRVKMLQGLNRSRQNSRRKLTRKHSEMMGLNKLDVAEVHSSPAITNLLSRLYPNPYNLLNLLEIQDKSMDTQYMLDASDSCKIKFKASTVISIKDSIDNQEINSLTGSSTGIASEAAPKTGDNKMETKPAIGRHEITTNGPLDSSVASVPEKGICQKLKRKMVAEPVLAASNKSEHMKTGGRKLKEREVTSAINDIRQRSKMTTTESKFSKKRLTKTLSATTEKLGGEESHGVKRRMSPARTKVSISTIHPLSLQKTACLFGDKGDRQKFSEQAKSSLSERKFCKGKKKVLSEKNKCVVKYLKLIKDLYEKEEKHLQKQIVNARNYVIDQIEKPDKKEDKLQRKSKQNAPTANDVRWKNCQGHTAKISLPKSWEKDKRGLVYTADVDEPIHSKKGQLLSAVITTPVEPCSSKLTRRIENPDSISKNIQNFDSCNQSQGDISRIIQSETYVLNNRKNIVKTSEGLPINVLNTVHETNRKIDLLIRQIDSSMNWLSQSEKSDSGKIASAIDKAEDLSDTWQLGRNLRRPTPESRNFCKRNDLILGQSFHSLHIFPIDNGVGSLRISADSLFSLRNQEYLRPGMLRTNPIKNFLAKSNKLLLPDRSNNFIKSTISGTDRCQSREDEHSQRSVISRRNFSLDAQVPEHATAPSAFLISVESTNELGSFVENSRQREIESNDSFKVRRKRNSSKVSLAEVKSALDSGQFILSSSKSFIIEPAKSLPCSLSINAVALDESASNLKPVIIQEITWNFYVPAPLPVTHVLYRNERSLVFTTMEASVLHVAITTSFLNLALMSVVQIIDQEPKQQSSIIISLHKCSSFVKNNDGLHESGKACKFVVLPSDVCFTEQSSGNIALSDDDIAEIKVLKKAETGGRKENCQDQPSDWNRFPSESSTEMFNGDKEDIKRIETLLRRTTKSPLTWLHPLPDQYETNPDVNRAGSPEPKNFHAIRTSPNREEEDFFPKMNGWYRGKVKFDSVAPSIFRYLSSETSNTSLDDKKAEDIKKISDTKIPLFPEIKKSLENTVRQEVPPKELRTADKPELSPPDRDNDNDSSSTSSFKSSNDCSDVSEVFELNLPKKRSKRAHFLDMLFHELRSFRKSLSKRKGPKRKTVQEEQKDSNEFQDALSDLNVDDKGGNKKQKVDEAVAVNTTCISKITIPASYAIPRKIFKTSFRGKESVTELMIDLKDVSISEVSDISVEKRKISTDHTKISIVISKHGDKVCCANRGAEPADSELQSPKASYHSLKPEKTNCIGWKKNEGDASDEDVDDEEDFKSVDSGNSMENIPINKSEDYVRVVGDEVIEPRREYTPRGKHKFDFYKKMENATSSFFTSKYGTEMSPLSKATTDMHVRVRNIQRNSFCTSDQYYERALRMAKMSAGYCQSCKSKTVIPEDPLGIYQKFIPRSCTRSPCGKQRKYYFKTTSSTNSSFYSIHSSNSDISDKFCHLNSSSSIVQNGLHRSRGPILRGSVDSSLPFFLGRTINF